MTALVHVEDLRHGYGQGTVLSIDALTLEDGRVHVAGPNGAGKTTLLSILATLTTPAQGEVIVCGHLLPDAARQARAALGYAGHAHSLHASLPAREALQLHAQLHGVDPSQVDDALSGWGLAAQARTPVRHLSHGQARRLDLARALLHRPRVLLLDEPATGLDTDALATLDARIAQADPELVIVAAPADPGLPTSDRVTLVDGRVVTEGRTP